MAAVSNSPLVWGPTSKKIGFASFSVATLMIITAVVLAVLHISPTAIVTLIGVGCGIHLCNIIYLSALKCKKTISYSITNSDGVLYNLKIAYAIGKENKTVLLPFIDEIQQKWDTLDKQDKENWNLQEIADALGLYKETFVQLFLMIETQDTINNPLTTAEVGEKIQQLKVKITNFEDNQ